MRAVVQRVFDAAVRVEGETVGTIGRGLLVYLGAGREDAGADVAYMASKIAGLRVFQGEDGRMTRSVLDVGGEVLVVSQFTLYGDVRKGRRPSFTGAADPEPAEAAYQRVVQALRDEGLSVATGRFRATMEVESRGDGPVTVLIDSQRRF